MTFRFSILALISTVVLSAAIFWSQPMTTSMADMEMPAPTVCVVHCLLAGSGSDQIPTLVSLAAVLVLAVTVFTFGLVVSQTTPFAQVVSPIGRDPTWLLHIVKRE